MRSSIRQLKLVNTRELLVFLVILGAGFADHCRAYAKPMMDLREAQAAFDSKNYEKTISLLSPKLDQISREGFLLLANAYREAKNPTMEIKTLSAARGKFQDDDQLETVLGVAQLRTNRENEAKATLKDVLDRNPKYEPAYLALVDLYEKRKNRYELRILFQDMVLHVGRKPQYLQSLCELYTRDGIYDHAKNYCEEAIKRNPREPMNYVNLATTFAQTGKTPEANTTFKKSADSFSKSEPAQFFYAQFLDEQKKFVDAFKYYKRGTVADPQATRGWEGMAFAAIESQKYDDSLAALEKLCEIDNRNALRISRRATGMVLRTNQPEWLKKFQALVDKCEGAPKNFL